MYAIVTQHWLILTWTPWHAAGMWNTWWGKLYCRLVKKYVISSTAMKNENKSDTSKYQIGSNCIKTPPPLMCQGIAIFFTDFLWVTFDLTSSYDAIRRSRHGCAVVSSDGDLHCDVSGFLHVGVERVHCDTIVGRSQDARTHECSNSW